MIGIDSAAWAALIGAGAGAAVTVLLELSWKPAYARRRAAEVLRAEVRMNRKVLVAIAEHRTKEPGRVADTVALSSRGWDAVAEEIHYLPPSLLEAVLLCYAQFAEINLIASNYTRKVDLLLQLRAASPPLNALANELDSDSQVFGNALVDVIAMCDRLIPRLQETVDTGPPSWS